MTTNRRSARLQRLYSSGPLEEALAPTKPITTKKRSSKKNAVDEDNVSAKPDPKSTKPKSSHETLPRTREMELLRTRPDVSFIMGVDEAGRGPLAGPVVAAAILSSCATVDGICDSKQLTKEPVRDELYQRLVSSANLRYAVAVVDAKTIDEINILQATYEAMRMAAGGVLGLENVRYESKLSTSHEGNYVVTGATDENGEPISGNVALDPAQVISLIDGNRMPPSFPSEAEVMIKGDGREYLIGAASIIAKVSRDTLMHQYHEQYPRFLLDQHKGYGTVKHMELVARHGPLPIHRMTFAPLKHEYAGGNEKKDSGENQTKGRKKAEKKIAGDNNVEEGDESPVNGTKKPRTRSGCRNGKERGDEDQTRGTKKARMS
jgi:ribonuclease HII